MKTHDRMKKFLALVLSFSLLTGSAGAAVPDEKLHIRSVEDWEQFCTDCRLDTWSQGKTVVLDADLDLTGKTLSVPTFSGTFDGQGHSISGLYLTVEGDHQGLFRYLRGGEVRNLAVAGVVAPSGTAAVVGGIVGVNSGLVQDCTFNGLVSGGSSIGGLVGINEKDGQVQSCTMLGGCVSGEHYTGGVAGENYGTLADCTNAAKINTQAAEPVPQLGELDWTQLNNTENLPACTDTGGIAGYTGGVIRACVNTGDVGYPHLGYNVGGIAGRQSGYLEDCSNLGTVQGRKDVGGIVGQMEPYTLLRYKEDTLQKLTTELEGLSEILSGALSDGDSSRAVLIDHLNAINRLTGNAKGQVSGLLDQVEELGEGTVETANDLSRRVSQIVDRAVPVSEDLERSAQLIADALGQMEDALETADELEEPLTGTADGLSDGLQEVEQALRQTETAIHAVSEALSDLLDGIGNDRDTEEALDRLSGLLDDYWAALDGLKASVERLSELFRTLPDWEGGELREIGEALGTIVEELGQMTGSARALPEAVHRLLKAIRENDKPEAALWDLIDAFERFAGTGKHLRRAVEALEDTRPALEAVWDTLAAASDQAQEGLDSFSQAGSAAADALDHLHTLIQEQADQPALEFPTLGSEFHRQEDALNGSLDALGEELQGINDALDQTGADLSGSLRDLNDQFQVITTLLKESRTDPEADRDLVVDVSEEDIVSATAGKLLSCANEGRVEGDVNIGGITGSMAIEFDFDPEDDVTDQGDSSLRFQYLTRAIVQDSKNEGPVTARKDYAGGVVGRMDLGIALGCESYGAVESTGGQYVGGIAGSASGSIRDCWAKCLLTGLRRVGGVAGWCTDARRCRTLVEIENADSLVGAVAGETGQDSVLEENLFVSERLGGVDGISYEGKAQPVSYEDFLRLPEVPDPFQTLHLTFTAEGQEVAALTVGYGEAVPAEDIPALPPREGFYGCWSDFDADCIRFDTEVEAIYQPWRTTLMSDDRSVLAEGQFRPDAVLTVTPGTHALPAEGNLSGGPWQVEVPAGEADFTALRLAIPEGGRHPQVWFVNGDGVWQKVDAQEKGSYLRAELSGHSAEICVTASEASPLVWYALGGGGALVLAVVLLRKVSAHHKKKQAKRAQTPAGEKKG